MDWLTALLVLLVIGVVAWLLPVPGIVIAVAVVIVLIAAVAPLIKRPRA